MKTRIYTFLTGPVIVSIILAFIIGACFILLVGYSPIEAYNSMLTGSFLSSLGIINTVQRAVPLIGMAIATSIAFRAGVLNIGTEGQMIVGGTVAALTALYLPGPGFMVMILALVVGALAGAAWASIPAILQFWPGVPILITSLLLSYPARFGSSWLIRFPFKDPETSTVATRPIRNSVQLPALSGSNSMVGNLIQNIFGRGSVVDLFFKQINYGLIIVLVVVAFVCFMNRRTVFGYESGLSGLNPRFVEYGGANVKLLLFKTMWLSGGLSGLIGAIFVIGAPNNRLIEGAIVSTNYAWTGLLVAMLALYRPTAVLLAGIFFGAIMAGSGAMSRSLGMSPQIAAVIQGLVIILLTFQISLPSFKKGKSDFSVKKEEATDHV